MSHPSVESRWFKVEAEYVRGIIAWIVENCSGEFKVSGEKVQGVKNLTISFSKEEDAVGFSSRFDRKRRKR